MTKVDLVERYVKEVERKLPLKAGEDISAELRSLIMDVIEEKTKEQRSIDDEDIVMVLKEFGSPEDIARRYAPQAGYLIGPQLYGIYLQVIRVVMGVTLIGVGIALVVEFAQTPLSIPSLIGRLVSGILSAAVGVFGTVTLVFALLERVLPESNKGLEREKEWDPTSLPPVNQDQQVVLGESLFSIALAVAALVVANLALDGLGSGIYQAGEGLRLFTILDYQVVAKFIPFWNILWGLTLIHEIALLVKGRWSRGSRLQAILLDCGIIVFLIFLMKAPLVDIELLSLGNGEQAEPFAKLAQFIPQIVRGIIIGAILFTFWDIGEQLRGFLRSSRS